jgi:TonB family protein
MGSHQVRIVLLILAALVAGASTAPPTLRAQEEVPRKAKKEVQPSYPQLARQLKVQGTVRVSVVIAPDGKVRSAHALGGSPLLIPPAEEAAKHWTFETASKETTQVLEFNFVTAVN